MCGRSSLHDAPTNVLERFRLPPVLPGFKPRYNVAPTQQQWTLGLDATGSPEAKERRWGLIPSWANDPAIGNRLINARSDSLMEKPAFREALERRRCLILADGYYEWTGTSKSKVPLYFHMKDSRAFAMAGLWERWGRGETAVETCTVVTTDASTMTSAYHPRMPVLLDLDEAEQWINRSTTVDAALALLRPYESAALVCYRVSKLVNSPANDVAECILPAAPDENNSSLTLELF
ncbi:MAG: SOS response-associated peptidase [Gemmatimonadales bacterium]